MDRTQLDEHVKDLRFLVRHLFAQAETDEQKQFITNLARQAYRSLGISAGILNLGCPTGWTHCDDGSCVPPGGSC
jgi:hypothetical protein